MIKVLFICHGNICRSPMAEFVMKHLVQNSKGVKEAGFTFSDFEIASAATSTEEIGNSIYPPAKRLLESHGIDCSSHSARQMKPKDYAYYDYIVLMDSNNLRNIRWNISAKDFTFEINAISESSKCGKISLLMDWTSRPGDVADPWYTRDFESTWIDVNEGCKGLLNHICNLK